MVSQNMKTIHPVQLCPEPSDTCWESCMGTDVNAFVLGHGRVRRLSHPKGWRQPLRGQDKLEEWARIKWACCRPWARADFEIIEAEIFWKARVSDCEYQRTQRWMSQLLPSKACDKTGYIKAGDGVSTLFATGLQHSRSLRNVKVQGSPGVIRLPTILSFGSSSPMGKPFWALVRRMKG